MISSVEQKKLKADGEGKGKTKYVIRIPGYIRGRYKKYGGMGGIRDCDPSFFIRVH